MLNEDEHIQLFQGKNRMGASITRRDYDTISHFLLEAVAESGSISLTDLVDRTAKLDAKMQTKVCSVLLLHVKKDLEVRGKIKIEHLPNRVQLIRLNGGKKRLKYKKLIC